jgi:peroxiredoxin Q/BCP
MTGDTGAKKAGCDGITTVESVLRGCMTITEGQTVPEFSLSDQDGTTVTSAQLRGGWAVVYFYPKDDTPGCTAESCSFRDNFEAFTDAGAKVIGISSDSVESHKAFAQKHNLPFTLLADTDSAVRKQFGVSKTLGLLPGRVTYVIDPDGIVRKVFSSQFKPKKHIDEALAVISKS